MPSTLHDVWLEFRYALRACRRTPASTTAAVLTLALGIGGATALFSVVYGVLLRPLPYRDADRLVLFPVERTFAGRPTPEISNFSLNDLTFWLQRPHALESVALSANGTGALSNDTGTTVVAMATVTQEFFETVQGRLVLGRPLGSEDDLLPRAVISERLWRQHFGGSRSVVGARLTIDAEPYDIVGVADATFQLPTPATDVWRPAGFARALDPTIARPRAGGFLPIARLRPGASVAAASEDCRAVLQAITEADARAGAGVRGTAVRLRDQLVRNVRPALVLLFAATGLVFGISCVNVTSLVLVRQAAQARDRAIRLALGASRGRLAFQTFVHSAMVSAAGSVVGVAVAGWTVAALARARPDGLPRIEAIRLDLPVLLFAVGVGVLSVLGVGLLPALQPAQGAQAFRLDGLRSIGARSSRRTRRLLVVVELAASLVLLVGASLLGRSFVRLLTSNIGANIDHVMAARVDVSYGRHLSSSDERGAIDRIVQDVRRLPGVVSAGAGASVPPNRAMLRITLNRADEAVGQPTNFMVDAIPATPDFFPAIGLGLRSGRLFTQTDDETHPQVMVMSRNTAREMFGAGDVLGKRLTLPVVTDYPRDHDGRASVALIGIVDDVKYSGMAVPSDGVIYRPLAQQPWASMFIVVRTAGPPAEMAPAIRRAITEGDRAALVYSIEPLTSLVAADTAPARFRTVILGLTAMLAVALAGVGLYGVVAGSAAQRTSEFGVRLALGGTAANVLALVLREGLVLAAGGIGLGFVAAVLAARLLTHLLYGVGPGDPLSFAGAGVLLLIVTLGSSYLPARSAMRVDPLTALRSE